MIDFEELLAVAYKKERMQSRRLARGAAISEHAALLRTLEKSAGVLSLRAFIDARRAAQLKDADAQRSREIRRAERTREVKRRKAQREAGGWRGWFDGSALPNPGRLGIGGVLVGPRGETVEISVVAGCGDSSMAEYLALIAVLEAALREKARDVVIHGDSRVVIDDLSAPAGMGIRALAQHAARARALIGQIGDVRIQWIPRARNARADALSREALGSARAMVAAA
ncbi:ribonuclease HI family protein [Caballeronia ptereochthonis]|uniref:Bifunctional RNase H/acid phosphatase n=1 Tax=Caballeronia ptereochthonis TaxID=1777144 RepID=A0A158A5A8_9BURK|nr:ribonuclease HI family protein [Caballeronia ptereochthonis]SAK52978.1 bifunctional RNase H/acid phosphatase [Caballeronia ptereochthonis]